MKKILALSLILILIFSLCACGESEENTSSATDSASGVLSSETETDGATDPTKTDTASESLSSSDTDAVTDTDGDSATASSDAATDTDTNTSSDADTDTEQGNASTENVEVEAPVYNVYNETVDHKFITTDIINFSLVVYDMNLCKGDFNKLADDSAIIWEWKSKEDPNCHYANKIIRSISGVKFRYSAYYKRDVVIACANFGWVGVIDYENCSLLWECQLPTGPHSVEMLPNGDVVVGSADSDGALIYFALSAGATAPTHSIVSPSCHGVCWDPKNEWLWVLEKEGVYACMVENPGTMVGKLVRLGGTGAKFSGDSGGHAFAPIAGQPGKYWVSARKLWVFDAEKETLSLANEALITGAIKGICSFNDQTVVVANAGLCGKNVYSWGSDGFRIITREMSTGKVSVPQYKVTVVPITGREFYKIQAFSKNYQ